jgi:hypothetical protein
MGGTPPSPIHATTAVALPIGQDLLLHTMWVGPRLATQIFWLRNGDVTPEKSLGNYKIIHSPEMFGSFGIVILANPY